METDQQNSLNASDGTINVGGIPSVSGDVSMEGSLDSVDKEHCLLNPKIDNHIYRQDVVRRNDGSLIGVVTEVAGDSDSDSDSESESGITDDDDDNNDDDDNDSPYTDEDKGEEEGNGERIEGKVKDDNVDNEGDDKDEKGESSESSDDNERGPLIADHVRVLWMDDSETSHHRNELTVIDRGFLHGDYVASALDPTGQVGLVVDVSMTVDLLAPDGSIVKDVSSREVKRVRDITVGDYVVSGPWLGRVDDVLDNVTVLFDDGSICKIQGAEPLRLRPIAKNLLEDGHCPYHPGQRVKAGSSSVFKDGNWLSGRWKANRRLEATVIKVTVGSVYVHWISSSGYGPDASVSPAEEQSPKNLKLLSCFSHVHWQLGDWCFLPSHVFSSSIPLDKGLSKLQLQESEKFIPEESSQNVESMDHDGVDTSDGADGNALNNISPKSSSCSSSLSVSKDNVQETWHTRRKKLRKVVVKRDKKPRKKEENFERALLIVNTRTKVDVGWQDGTIEKGLDSTLLIPIESPGDHDFVAEQYVIEKAADDNEESAEIRRVGVIRSVDAKEKTACVSWLKQVTRPEDPREFEKEEIVSVYELEGHPDYDYCYGDVVVRLSPAVAVADDSEENLMKLNVSDCVSGDTMIDSNEKEAATGVEADSESSDLSWVGNITGLKNGDIEVTWADGMVSTVGPQAVYVVGRDDDESIVGGSDIGDAASWETLEDDEMDVTDDAEKTPDGTDNNPEAGNETAVSENNSGSNGPLGFAFEFIRMASGIFSRGRNHENSESSGENELQVEEEIYISDGRASSNVSDSQVPSVTDDGAGHTSSDMGVLDKDEAMSSLSPNGLDTEAPSGGNLCNFKRFDTAKDPSDHFFLGANTPGNNERKWLKKVQRDWSILQNNLPDGIYVRVYEDRMDLLRAVIVGAYGTPYQDGLFFFDFQMPPDYPDVPPSAHYHSGGWRINPNLYEEGKVCLSLLNTWTGRGNEVWDSKSSSILQVLVSLQGLVLNSRPYFNEAGYDKQIGTAEGEKNSLSYNENTFLLNCKTIMYLMRKPPKDFEDLVREHFKQRGYYILKACDAYMKGFLIGTLAKDALVTDTSEANATSAGFKLMLAKIVPKLISSLTNVGADCHEFKHLQES
ncbi:putative ubiquitin-conjugating enzyme E2 23 isoform X2 [Silene latifolia]|uniref:putative ubiquitin-conjugating enzyme E2 23 isoform X2 n=1 Tax=Silene latifolia TaxID=37657 RepID=UPI003D770F66